MAGVSACERREYAGAGSGGGGSYSRREGVARCVDGEAGWGQVPTVKNRQALCVDWRVDLANSVTIDALKDLAREMHP